MYSIGVVYIDLSQIHWKDNLTIKCHGSHVTSGISAIHGLFTAVLSEAWAKLRDWASAAGRG